MMPISRCGGILLGLLPGLLPVLGCKHGDDRNCPPDRNTQIARLVDLQAEPSTVPLVDYQLCRCLIERFENGRTDPPGRRFNFLVLSGGGSYGAYPAGLLVGWSEAGNRPVFDVITGVSTGALLATLAFLGPERDADIQRFYTTLMNDDIFERHFALVGILDESLADSEPLRQLIAETADAQLLAQVAAEHAKGRRLYVGTTNLDARRLVVWDMGAIASRGQPEDLELFRKILLASAAIPGFFPPVSIDVEVDGQPYQELHVDGGVSASMFFRPPQVTPAEKVARGQDPLHGSNLFVIVSGKVFADSACVDAKFIDIVSDSISALIFAQTRGDMFMLFTLALVGGMNYYLSAIPPETPLGFSSTTFEPEQMRQLFEVGRQLGRSGQAWRTSPPGLERGEQTPSRGGIKLAKPAAWPPGIAQLNTPGQPGHVSTPHAKNHSMPALSEQP